MSIAYMLPVTTTSVYGTVKDEFGDLLSNVNVFFTRDPRIGTITDQNGVYSFDEISTGEQLTFSYQGLTKKLIAGDLPKTVVFETLTELDEVVISATGDKKSYAGLWLLGGLVASMLLLKKKQAKKVTL